jgi:hypothetical protein
MRKSIILKVGLVIGLAVLAFVANAEAKSIFVPLTQQQVANVCGKDTSTGGGHTGCSKTCGLKKENVCDFDCNNKSGKCTGSCVTCAQRKFPFGENFPAHVVKQTVRFAP